jgi:CTP:phosphocholine cytidylyltransferase-like protein
MWPESPATEYSDEFTVDYIVKKVGPNYILDYGKLIEKQVEVKDKDRIRTIDIHMGYPRTYDEEFVFVIPEGYSVEGLENFNKYAVNKTGGFVSSAEIKEGKLVVKAKKYFNENYYPYNKWSEILKFLDASVEFYNTKLLLRKN